MNSTGLVAGVDMFLSVSAVSPTISSQCTGSILRDPVSGKSHISFKCPWVRLEQALQPPVPVPCCSLCG